MKRVIQVLGTVRSGTTYLSLLIASQFENAVCLGEVYPLFKPLRNEHREKKRELENNDERWKILLSSKPKDFYDNFFELFPEIDVIVESSKEPIWYHLTNVRKSDYRIYRILVYKNLKDLSASFTKRGSNASSNVYTKYHKKVFRILGNRFSSIKLKDLDSDENLKYFMTKFLGDSFDVTFELNRDLFKFNFFGSDTLFLNRSNADTTESVDCFNGVELRSNVEKVTRELELMNLFSPQELDMINIVRPKKDLYFVLIFFKDYLLR
jgi:glutathione peroxidase-family protein